jgi:hypothetical protein
MLRKTCLAAMLVAAPALSGCVVQAGLAAAELVRYLPETERASNAYLRPAATEACTKRAGQYGSVHIVDVQQQRADRLVVWGSVTDTQQRRRTFECHYTTALVRFKLREIGARS